MPTLKLTWRKLKAVRFGLIPIIMFILMTARTLTAGDGVMITGLCAALMPFFATARSATCNDGTFNDLIEALMEKPIEELKELYNTRDIEK